MDGGAELAEFLAELKSEATRTAYRADLLDFRRFLRDSGTTSLVLFASLAPSARAERVGAYVAGLSGRGAAAATINRRLAAIRGFLGYAVGAGLAAGSGHEIARNRPHRSGGAGLAAINLQCLLALPESSTERGARDASILRLFCENGLRTSEICAAEVGGYCLATRTLTLPCGLTNRTVFLSARTSTQISAYLRLRGHFSPTSPLFGNLDHRPAYRETPLTEKGIRFILSTYARQLGIRLSPRILRRTACEVAGKAMGQESGNVRAILDGEAMAPPPGGHTWPGQAEITGTLSELVSGPKALREAAARIRARPQELRARSQSLTARSAELTDRAAAITQRTASLAERVSNNRETLETLKRYDWRDRRSQEIVKRLEEQADVWAAFEYATEEGG